MNYEKIYTHCKIKKNEKPETKFIDSHKAVKVSLIDGPDKNNIKKLVVNIAGASWFPHYADNFDNDEDLSKEFYDVMDGKTLSQAIEGMQFTFLVEGLHLHSTHALVRNRIGIAYMQQSHAVSDLRHSDVVIPPKFDNSNLGFEYRKWVKKGKELYAMSLDSGDIAIEDARMFLPKTIPSHIYFSCNFMTLMSIIGKRLDTQEEGVQLNIMCEQIQDIFEKEYPYLRPYLKSQCEKGICFHQKTGYKANCIYKRDSLHTIENYEDEFTLHDKTKSELTGFVSRIMRDKK